VLSAERLTWTRPFGRCTISSSADYTASREE